MHQAVLEKLKSHKYPVLGGGLLLALLAVLAVFYVQASAVGGADNMISYCGEPDFFDQFSDQNGYTPNERCTDVVIDGYRIDTEESSAYYVNDNLQWGCSASVTVYEIQRDGGLEKVTDTGENSPDPGDVEVGPLTIQPLSQSSGLDFTNRCDWIANDYEYDFSGGLDVSASTPDNAYDLEEVPITVRFENQYSRDISGTVSAEFCTEGAFGLERCISRSADVQLSSGESSSETFSVPNENLGDVVEASAAFNGEIQVSGWEGVNLDCDQDNVIERVEDCDGFPVSASQELDDIVLTQPVSVGDVSGPRTAQPGEAVNYSVDTVDSVSVSWSNGDSGDSATYNWSSTGNKTVEVTVDDGVTSTSKQVEVMVDDKSFFDPVFEFFGGLWDVLTFQG